MALYQSAWATSQRTTPKSGCAGQVVAQLFEWTLPASTTLAIGDIIELGVLPDNCAPSDGWFLPDDFDTNGTPTIAADIGIMSGTVGALLNDDGSARTCGNELFSASNAAQSGTPAQMTAKSALTLATDVKDRSIGVKLTAAAATQAAAGVKLRLLLSYRSV